MREKHLIKPVSYSRRVSTKTMKQCRQAPNKLPRHKERFFFLLHHPKLTPVYLHSLQLYVTTAPNVCIQIGCLVKGVFTIPFATSKQRTTTFSALRLTNWDGEFYWMFLMVNSNVNRFSELHRNYLLTWWLRCANGLQTCSFSTPAATMVKSHSFNPLWTMITTVFQDKTNTNYIPEPKVRRFFPQTLCQFVHLEQFRWLVHSFSFAKKHCNTCDWFLFSFHLFSHFLLSFLIL